MSADERTRELNRLAVARYRAAHPDRVRASQSGYDTSEAGRERLRRHHQADLASGKTAARNAVYRALKNGQLAKQPCRRCGDPVVHAHHWRGYSVAARLDVQWFCFQHHADAHGMAA